MTAKVFISYRRDDSRYQARMIYDSFRKVLPRDHLFMDVDSIPVGLDFVETLRGRVEQCNVLLALIGPRWIDAADPKTGQRRLENPDDFVRTEIREALIRGISVVPVLLDGAGMPDPGDLPADLKRLSRRQAEHIQFHSFDSDVERLIKKLSIHASPAGVGALPESDGSVQARIEGPRAQLRLSLLVDEAAAMRRQVNRAHTALAKHIDSPEKRREYSDGFTALSIILDQVDASLSAGQPAARAGEVAVTNEIADHAEAELARAAQLSKELSARLSSEFRNSRPPTLAEIFLPSATAVPEVPTRLRMDRPGLAKLPFVWAGALIRAILKVILLAITSTFAVATFVVVSSGDYGTAALFGIATAVLLWLLARSLRA